MQPVTLDTRRRGTPLNRQPLRYEKAGFPRGLGEDDGCLKNNIRLYAKLRMAKDDAVRWAPPRAADEATA